MQCPVNLDRRTLKGGHNSEAYNNYVYDKFGKVSDWLRPIALNPPQEPARPAEELRRAVNEGDEEVSLTLYFYAGSRVPIKFS